MQKKICMLGSFGVGKTSLVRQYVEGFFSDVYQTTIGVRIDKKSLDMDGERVDLILWDLAGEDEFEKMRANYLKGAAGYLLVMDGTRRKTIDEALAIHERHRNILGDLPFVVVVNKDDLRNQWQVTEEDLEELRTERGWHVMTTSAISGPSVEAVFQELTKKLLSA